MLNDCVFTLCNEKKHQLECNFKLQVSTEPWYFNWIVIVCEKKGGVDFYVTTDCRTVEKGVVE